ncbi:MAG: hypothetical protein ABIJ09_26880 [Pseudomonadota bacterium]
MTVKAGLVRRLGLLTLALGLGACGATDCGGCLAPLDQPFPESRKFNGAAQVRLTPSGVAFLESNLPAIIQSFASFPCDSSSPDYLPCPSGMSCIDGSHCEQNGVVQPVLGFKVPSSVTDSGCWKKVAICENPSSDQCRAYVHLLSVALAPTAPATIDVTVQTEAYSTWLPLVLEDDCSWGRPWCCLSPAPDCDVQILRKQRAMAMDLNMRTDNPLQRLELEFGDPDIPFSESDLEIKSSGGIGSWLGCGAAELLMPLLFPLFEDSLRDQLNSSLTGAMTDAMVESCDPPAQCTAAVATTCDGDKRCHFASGGRYVPTLMGVEGGMDLAGMLGAFAGQATEAVGVSIAAGGYAEVVAEGIELGMRGGTDVQASLCVPPMDTPLPVPPRLNFGNSVPHPETGADTPFMVGIAVADRMLDQVARGAVQSGAFCQRIDSGLSSYINTGALGLLASSLGNITRGGAKPALIEILPRAPIVADIGLGTTAVDPSDPNRTILDKPLLTLHAHDLDLDLYGLVDDRYLRFMTMRANLRIGIGLDDDGQGNMLVLVSGVEDWIQDVQVLNSELLTDPPEDIEAAVPALIGAMLGQFAPDLTQTIALPDLAGFALEGLTLRGVQQRLDGSTPVVDALGNPVFEFMGIFSNLRFDPAQVGSPLRYSVDTVVGVRRFEQPAAEAFHVSSPQGVQGPLLELDVSARDHDGDDLEFSHRVDGGFWRPFHRGQVLHVTDPLLQLMGRHRIEVRGRRVGAPSTLDLSPAVLEVIVDPVAPTLQVSLDRAGRLLQVVAHDGVTPDEDLRLQVRVDGTRVHSQTGLDPIRLDGAPPSTHHIEVEVLDEAGNVAHWSQGAIPPRWPTAKGNRPLAEPGAALDPAAAEGCDCTASRPASGLWLLILLVGTWHRSRRFRAARR